MQAVDATSRGWLARSVPLAMAVALLGGGAALAAPGILGGGDATIELAVDGSEDDASRELLAEHCSSDQGADDPFCGGPSETGDDHEEPTDADDPADSDPGDGDPADDDPTDGDPSDADDPNAGEGTDAQRSDTARRVHRALSGGALSPGDPGFGQAVASRACTGALGSLVSRAARGEELADEELALQPCEPRGRGRRAAEDGGSVDDDGGVTEADGTTADPGEAASSDDDASERERAEAPGATRGQRGNDAAEPRDGERRAEPPGRGGEGAGSQQARPGRGGPPAHAGGQGGGQGRGRG
jgi:hypothetical protein